MAKVAIKFEKLSLFGGFFLIMEQFFLIMEQFFLMMEEFLSIMEEFLSIMEEFNVYSVKTTNNHGWLGWFNKPSIRP